MTWLYAALDAGAVAAPLLMSFDRKVAFWRVYRDLFPAIGAMMLLFVPWDMVFVQAGVWGFDSRYISGIWLGNLPIEEWLFFPVVAYACVFIYECLRVYAPRQLPQRVSLALLWGTALIGLVVAGIHPYKLYTSMKVGAASLALVAALRFEHREVLTRFLWMYVVSLVPFLLMNGVLTGSFIDGQVVWYAPEQILGVRIATIPVEDAYYSLFMLLVTTVVYERLRSRRLKATESQPNIKGP